MSEREVTQEHVDKLVLIADRVRYMRWFDVGGDARQCPFCYQFAFDNGNIEHRENCAHLIAKTLMDELYPEEQEQEGAQ